MSIVRERDRPANVEKVDTSRGVLARRGVQSHRRLCDCVASSTSCGRRQRLHSVLEAPRINDASSGARTGSRRANLPHLVSSEQAVRWIDLVDLVPLLILQPSDDNLRT